MNNRSWLEEKGWGQGNFIAPDDVNTLRSKFPDLIRVEDDVYLIVASQSCDVCARIEHEPYIEFSFAKKIDKPNGNYMHNKNPRRLHITANHFVDGIVNDLHLELFANDKISIKKDDISSIKLIEPDVTLKLSNTAIQQYANWLAARYNRAALPTTFEFLFNEQWKKSKREKDSEKYSEYILGIYVDINPDKEIIDGEKYSVQLLFLISPTAEHKENVMQSIKELANKYSDNLKAANMDVVGDVLIKTKNQVSLATFANFKRFNLDSLSYKNDHPIEPAVK
ncbi:hypothetical protein [Pasteurella multocida]|uniref:hypothetical protein n=1 Tax=Pasteurella multocida TaxID=747 RepID=UPI003979E6E3